jgi:hypothetical protein
MNSWTFGTDSSCRLSTARTAHRTGAGISALPTGDLDKMSDCCTCWPRSGEEVEIVPHLGHTVAVTGDVMDHGGQMMITADALKMVSR